MEIHVPTDQPSTYRRFVHRAGRLPSTVPVPAIAAILGTAIATFMVVGILQRTAYPGWALANLDSETSIATYFSATLLWAAAAGWLLVALLVQPRVRSLWVWTIVLAWLAVDEGAAIHERVEKWSGVDWQVLYLPVLAGAGITWWAVLRRYRYRKSVDVMLVAGASAWAVTLLLEMIQNWGGDPVTAAIYNPAMVAEEGLEMVGSTVFLIAALLALRMVPQPLTTPEPTPPGSDN